jgi:hypothetical protein
MVASIYFFHLLGGFSGLLIVCNLTLSIVFCSACAVNFAEASSGDERVAPALCVNGAALLASLTPTNALMADIRGREEQAGASPPVCPPGRFPHVLESVGQAALLHSRYIFPKIGDVS